MATQEAPKKRKVFRKNKKLENAKAIKQTLIQVANEKISVQEFVALISPHTSDKGEALTKVMTDDLTTFRKLVIKVYDNMSQDVSDVLANEQIDIARLYSQKLEFLKSRIHRALSELERLNPNFNFKHYHKNPKEYLENMFQTADMPDEEEMAVARRHIAYQRLQWMRMEHERLQAENDKLQVRLNELKDEQQKELRKTLKKEIKEEQTKVRLEEKQEVLQNKLEELNTSLQEAIVRKEKEQKPVRKSNLKKPAGKKGKGKALVKPPSRPAWEDVEVEFASTTASQIEASHVIEEIKDMNPSSPHRIPPAKPITPARSEASSSRQQTFGRRGAYQPRDSWKGFQ